ncbi:permease for cytosine/purines, uracil, thiamine, allantoin-domain-containing protein [Schizophyllum commune]
MRNTFPPNIGMKTHEFVAYIIFWVLCCPILLLKPEKYRIPAMVSSIIVTVAAITIFIWALAKQGGPGPLYNNPEAVYGVGHLQGSALAWTVVRLIVSHIGAWSGGARVLNGPLASLTPHTDFSRYAVRPGDQMWGQLFAIPLCLFGSNVLGIFATSCAKGFFPDEKPLWKLYDLLEAIQRHGGPSARAAVFFAAFAFFLSQLCVNVVACGVVGGMDLAALCPRFINIRRGSVLVAIIGICINPWRILNTANSFISAISAFGVFLGPMSGIMLADYHLLRGRQLKLSHLFLPAKASDYWFWHGLNWRAPVAWVLGVFPSMPGFCADVTPETVVVSESWTRVYYLSWLLGCAISGSVHLSLSKIWPPPGVGEADLVDVYETYEAGVYDGSGKDGGKGLDEEEVVGSPDEKDSKMLQ